MKLSFRHIKAAYIVLLLGVSMPHGQLLAQDRSFKKESLEEYRQDKEYQYGLQPGPEEVKEPDLYGSELDAQMTAARIGRWFMYIIIFVAFGIIAALLINQYGNFRKLNRGVASQALAEEEEIDDIKIMNFGQRILDAEHAGNYRLAIRWQFLRALKKLNDRKLIHWQKNKTNRDYYYEISKLSLKDPFDTISMVFEHVWYGDFPTNAGNYERMKPYFQNFINQVK
ncbi:MAG: DUF4129 domain-containing protein [Bacteroidia bacterium]|nr:DUF4129 domain-containing protein [Bacteroidia bacterium]